MEEERGARTFEAASLNAHASLRITTILICGVALFAGAGAGLRDPQWALVAAAIVFGWSQIGGA
jgi:hypothetical protein